MFVSHWGNCVCVSVNFDMTYQLQMLTVSLFKSWAETNSPFRVASVKAFLDIVVVGSSKMAFSMNFTAYFVKMGIVLTSHLFFNTGRQPHTFRYSSRLKDGCKCLKWMLRAEQVPWDLKSWRGSKACLGAQRSLRGFSVDTHSWDWGTLPSPSWAILSVSSAKRPHLVFLWKQLHGRMSFIWSHSWTCHT